MVFHLSTEVLACEPTGNACDATIEPEATVPEEAVGGETVTAVIKIDNLCYALTPGKDITRYRIKVNLNGDVSYNPPFEHDSWGKHDETISFIMPPSDVTLIATIERCNLEGEWERCEDTFSERTYTIKYAEAVGPKAKFVEGSYPKEIPPGDYATGWDYKFKSKLKNVGTEKGEFRVYVYKDNIELGYIPFLPYWVDIEPGEVKDFNGDFSFLIERDSIIEIKAWEENRYKIGGEPDQVIQIPVSEKEMSLFDQIMMMLADMLGITETQAKLVLIAAAALLILSALK